MKDKKQKYGYKIFRRSIADGELIDYLIGEKNFDTIDAAISHAKNKIKNMDIKMQSFWYIVPFTQQGKSTYRFMLKEIVCIKNGKVIDQVISLDDDGIYFV